MPLICLIIAICYAVFVLVQCGGKDPPPEKIYPGTYYRVVTPVMYISVESPVLSLVYIRQENHA